MRNVRKRWQEHLESGFLSIAHALDDAQPALLTHGYCGARHGHRERTMFDYTERHMPCRLRVLIGIMLVVLLSGCTPGVRATWYDVRSIALSEARRVNDQAALDNVMIYGWYEDGQPIVASATSPASAATTQACCSPTPDTTIRSWHGS